MHTSLVSEPNITNGNTMAISIESQHRWLPTGYRLPAIHYQNEFLFLKPEWLEIFLNLRCDKLYILNHYKDRVRRPQQDCYWDVTLIIKCQTIFFPSYNPCLNPICFPGTRLPTIRL